MRLRKLTAVAAVTGLLCVLSSCSAIGGITDMLDDGKVTAVSLTAGDCIVSSDLGESFDKVPRVECTEPHDAEVVSVFKMPNGDFDEEAMDDAALVTCFADADSYLGGDYSAITSEGLEVIYFTPSSQSWAAGDHEVTCLVATVSQENELTSSVKGMGA